MAIIKVNRALIKSVIPQLPKGSNAKVGPALESGSSLEGSLSPRGPLSASFHLTTIIFILQTPLKQLFRYLPPPNHYPDCRAKRNFPT